LKACCLLVTASTINDNKEGCKRDGSYWLAFGSLFWRAEVTDSHNLLDEAAIMSLTIE